MMRCAPVAGARIRIHECVAGARPGRRRAHSPPGLFWVRADRGLVRGPRPDPFPRFSKRVLNDGIHKPPLRCAPAPSPTRSLALLIAP